MNSDNDPSHPPLACYVIKNNHKAKTTKKKKCKNEIKKCTERII